jgi:hypothetical protein
VEEEIKKYINVPMRPDVLAKLEEFAKTRGFESVNDAVNHLLDLASNSLCFKINLEKVKELCEHYKLSSELCEEVKEAFLNHIRTSIETYSYVVLLDILWRATKKSSVQM